MPQRLIVLILVPTVAAVVLAGVRIDNSVSESQTYTRVQRMTELSAGITQFVTEFTSERDLAVDYIAAGRPEGLLPQVQSSQFSTDAQTQLMQQAAVVIDSSYGTDAVRGARSVLNRVNGVKALRGLVIGGKVQAFTVMQKYTSSIEDLIAVLDSISTNVVDTRLTQSSRALGALLRAKEAVSRQRALLLLGARQHRLTTDEMSALNAARAQEDNEIKTFRNSVSLEQAQVLDDTVIGGQVDQAKEVRQRVITAVAATGGRLPRALSTPAAAEAMKNAMSDLINKMRLTELDLTQDILDLSDARKADARKSTIIDSIIVALLLAIVLLITIVMARSLVRPLRRLQSGALDVAGTRLPGLVDRLRDPEAAAGGIEVEPIDVDSTDEIGQVARAFDEVHREAVRLAADEAVLRGNINAMFVNLSRRSQSLIERQLRLIETLEQSERDEEQLGNLFRLDHLATRMRRNCENLLVLGGQEQVRRWNRPVPLIDVIRASLSEVEQYERVALRVQGDMTVAGPVVNDLVHLLAELVENATVFSSEHTKVTVSGQMLSGGGSMLQITDNGVGMSPEDLEQANWRLANPPVIDFSAARRMGLFVVGRLAVRHGIRVELRAAQGGGLTAFVVLPDAMITPGESGVGNRPLGSRENDGQLAALGSTPEPPALGVGGAFQQDGHGPGRPAPAPMGDGTGAFPTVGGVGGGVGGNTGSHPMVGNTGSHPMVGGTGPLRPVRGATGPQPTFSNGPQSEYSGPQSEYSGPQSEYSGPQSEYSGPPSEYPTGAMPAVPPVDPAGAQGPPSDQRPQRRPGELPVRRPGAQLPGRPVDDGPNGLFQPHSERMRDGGHNGAHPPERRPENRPEPRPERRPATGPQSVVPEAQPIVPESGSSRQIPWETGPLEQVGGESDFYAGGSRTGPHEVRWTEEHVSAPTPPEEAVPEPRARDPRMRAAPQAPPPTPPPPPEPKAPPRLPERSPIFDAMQSEWFLRRAEGSGEDPVRGWESPADAGFRAAEAIREPVTASRTDVGLPKRVPGKNRIPGAVGRATTSPANAPAANVPAAADQQPAGPAQDGALPGGTTEGQAVQGQQGQQAQQAEAHGQTADAVRSRFASLQRGVHRGRHETRGDGTSGETPSQRDDETGGTR
ncbi:nitrate- and nitrite sensing domain-containing protein [Actinomadura meridiana]|uniref:nitrate- and nitrite sensing domain-containing protein n=1 Tax=Actinomadura meridiana TaxID=559626 RepID=UPI0031F087C1